MMRQQWADGARASILMVCPQFFNFINLLTTGYKYKRVGIRATPSPFQWWPVWAYKVHLLPACFFQKITNLISLQHENTLAWVCFLCSPPSWPCHPPLNSKWHRYATCAGMDRHTYTYDIVYPAWVAGLHFSINHHPQNEHRRLFSRVSIHIVFDGGWSIAVPPPSSCLPHHLENEHQLVFDGGLHVVTCVGPCSAVPYLSPNCQGLGLATDGMGPVSLPRILYDFTLFFFLFFVFVLYYLNS